MNNISDLLQKELFSAIDNSYPNIFKMEDVKITKSKNKKFGDYSSNIAFLVSKQLKKNILTIGNEIKNKLVNFKLISKIDIADNGFLNFYINNEFYIHLINKILNEKEDY